MDNKSKYFKALTFKGSFKSSIIFEMINFFCIKIVYRENLVKRENWWITFLNTTILVKTNGGFDFEGIKYLPARLVTAGTVGTKGRAGMGARVGAGGPLGCGGGWGVLPNGCLGLEWDRALENVLYVYIDYFQKWI